MSSYDDNWESEKKYEEGKTLFDNGNYKEAIKVFAEAIILCPSYDKARLGLSKRYIGACYKKLGDDEKANKYLAEGCENLGDYYAHAPAKSNEQRYENDKKAQEFYDKAKKYRGEDCFITSAVCDYCGKPDDCVELTTLRNYRDGWLKNQADGKKLIEEYYKIAPKIVRSIRKLSNCKEIFSSLLSNYIEPCIELINSGKFVECKNLYIKMVNYAKTISK